MPSSPPRGRRRAATQQQASTGLSRETIVAKAIELIDDEGLDSFGIRSVAKALGVFPTAIYWHVPSRHTLVADVITVVLADLVPPRDLPWEDWVYSLFTRYRAIIARHPNVAPLIGAQLVSNASVDLELIEHTLAKLEDAGFSDARLAAAYNAVIGGMVGFVTQEFALVAPDKKGDFRATIEHSIEAADARQYPRLARLAPTLLNKAYLLRWENGISAPLEAGFELYTEAIIAGLKRIAKT